jgi:hypothetical protein
MQGDQSASTARSDEAASAREARLETATYIDSDGVQWWVRERDVHNQPGAPFPVCLVFNSDDKVRRVWAFPDDWCSFSSLALEALSWHR